MCRRSDAKEVGHQRLIPSSETVLLVEDSMIIALDAEDALKGLGARSVTTAASVGRAIAVLKEQKIDFALLDVNLGAENSAPVAQQLVKMSIPFVFATGYGDGAVFLEQFPGAPVVNKPYGPNHLLIALDGIIIR